MPSKKTTKPKSQATTKEEPRLKVLVSSVVLGYQDFLESIYALLEQYGYEVAMSHKGTLPVDPEISAMSSCVQAVDDCDLFLGVILPRYGSGKEEADRLSIMHREALSGHANFSGCPHPA